MPDPELVAAYEAAVFDVVFPSGTCSFDSSGQPSGDSIDEAFGGITAWNPGWQRRTRQENDAANERLAKLIDARGWRRFDAVGRDRDNAYAERSFAVFGASEAELVALARHFEQAAIFWWDGERCRVVWC